MDKAQRSDIMLELRQKGMPYSTIGKTFSISRQRVHQILSGYTLPDKRTLKTTLLYNLVVKKANGQCANCKNGGRLIIHHKDGDDTNNNQANLEALCRPCHIKHHNPPLEHNFTQPTRSRTLRNNERRVISAPGKYISYRVTIPISIVETLKIRKGQLLYVSLINNQIVVSLEPI